MPTQPKRGTRILTNGEVRKIKAAIWNGATSPALANHFKVSESLVTAIRTGQRRRDIAWPDGTIGKLPKKQTALIAAKRLSAMNGILRKVERGA